ncbi:cell division protein FtsZ [Roseimicrobium gellanilyticum]|uniref:Cell division protein FtsZ n=1 Tax=Roseimicrobium gellanilyticum TaxID=748857 RepID=A0A366HD98_9BACT|nr:cell division protein FtsZ [Roseimicrobium gellanilyticum]RBP40431.1 cell division protein FtsZ [Roseimicrobium gellanilyticum]
MVEFQRNQDREPSATSSLKICVVGIGGGGLNVLDRICLDRLMEVSLVSMHTDVRVLGHAMAPLKIQLGAEMMRGIGCGGDPELGREAADASSDQIRLALQGHDMVFICAGLGGGTGSGAAPVVAQIARDLGAMVFVFATMPFSFEGRRRLTQAEMALEELQGSADAVILFENNRMGELVLPKEGIQKAFSQADQLIGHSVRAISTMVTQPGVVRMGLADLMTALRSPNARCLFGFGEARGTNRVQESLKRALKSPLVNQGQLLQNARNLLVHIAGGESLTLAEVEALMKQLGKYVPEETQIMFGLAVDAKLGDMMTVTLISSLTAQQMSLEPSADAVVEPRITSRPQPAPKAPVEKAPAYSGNGLQLHAPVGMEEPEPAPLPAPVPVAVAAPVAAPAPAPVAPAPAPVAKVKDPLPVELFAEFHEQPVALAPAPAPAPAPVPVQPAPQPVRQAPIVSVPVQMQEVPLFEEPVQAAPSAPLMMEAPQPLPVPPPVVQELPPVRTTIAQTPAPVYAPEPAPAVQAYAAPAPIAAPVVAEAPVQAPAPAPVAAPEPAPAPAPVAQVPQPEPEPVRAEAPVHETVEHEAPVVKEQSIKATSILVQSKPRDEEEVKPLVKQSIFSMVEDEEEEEEEDEDEEFVDEMEEDEVEEEEEEVQSSAPVEARSPEAAASHWADKYIQPKPHAGAQPSVEPRREPQRTLQTTASAPAKKVIEAKQPSLNLQQDEVARFKGTDKTIVDGDDLDIPTWMRMRGKVKR